MASITMCDRCSRLGKGEGLGGIALNPQLKGKNQQPAEISEICPECVASFYAWMEAGKDTGAGKPPFTAPYSPPADGGSDSETLADTSARSTKSLTSN